METATPTPLSTRASELLGCRYPLVLAGMGGVARAELVAAVTTAGGFGFLGMVRETPALITREVEELHRLGHRRFGVNLIPAATAPDLLAAEVEAVLALDVPVVALFWDLDAPLVRRFRDAGVRVVYQVGSPDEARAAVAAGAEIIIAQGVEAGGHVRGTTPLHQLLPEVVSAVEVPVLAAGGLADAPDFVTCLGLGAEGMVLGTALIPTTESFAHDVHKERLLAAASEDTVLTHAFHHNWPPGAAVRVLQSEVTGGRRGDPYASGRTVIGWEEGRPISLFSTDSPLRSTAGDLGAMALYAGMGVGRVSKMVGAGRRIAGIVAEAETLLAPPPSARPHSEPSSPVCYIGEVDPAYMGYLDRPALARGLIDLRDAARAELTGMPLRARPGEAVRPAALRLARWAVSLERCAARQATAPAAAGAAGTAAVGTLPERARSLMPLVIDDEVRALLQAMIADLEANSPAPAESAVPAC